MPYRPPHAWLSDDVAIPDLEKIQGSTNAHDHHRRRCRAGSCSKTLDGVFAQATQIATEKTCDEAGTFSRTRSQNLLVTQLRRNHVQASCSCVLLRGTERSLVLLMYSSTSDVHNLWLSCSICEDHEQEARTTQKSPSNMQSLSRGSAPRNWRTTLLNGLLNRARTSVWSAAKLQRQAKHCMWKADRQAPPGQDSRLRNATALPLHRPQNVVEQNHITTPCTIGNERIRPDADSRGRTTKLRRSSNMPNAPGFTGQNLAIFIVSQPTQSAGCRSL